MIGHCLGAAGGLEAIATVKAITTGWLHPSINQFVSVTFLCTPFFALGNLHNLLYVVQTLKFAVINSSMQ